MHALHSPVSASCALRVYTFVYLLRALIFSRSSWCSQNNQGRNCTALILLQFRIETIKKKIHYASYFKQDQYVFSLYYNTFLTVIGRYFVVIENFFLKVFIHYTKLTQHGVEKNDKINYNITIGYYIELDTFCYALFTEGTEK